MRLLLAFLAVAAAQAADFAAARPGYRFEFPRDDYAHPDFRTEWWYYTGNLRAPGGRRFGFELTFFRQAVKPEPAASAWQPRDLYLAHLALSDIEGGRFIHEERVNRAGPGLAGADAGRQLVWNGNWQAGPDSLRAVTAQLRIDLKLERLKPPAIHGDGGVYRKGAGAAAASHYVSYPRIRLKGRLELEEKAYEVEGLAWMDHEFFSHELEAGQVGWDWMMAHLDNGADLMLFRLRREGGGTDPNSGGSYIDAAGGIRRIRSGDFTMEPLHVWRSPATNASYPLRWRIRIPSLSIDLLVSTTLANQELVSRKGYTPTYWEGAVDYKGLLGGTPLRGEGYLELTGYAQRVRLGGDVPR